MPRSDFWHLDPILYSPHLRATARCVEADLHLPLSNAARDARAYCAEHDGLRAYVGKREGDPAGGEPVRNMGPRGRYRSLHWGRTRGITTWDEDNDVCWFVAYSETHASGEDRDCYRYFESLYRRSELAPTADDYESVWELSTEAVLDALRAIAKPLYSEARRHPGTEASRSFLDADALMLVDLIVEDDGDGEQGWILLTVPRDIAHGPDVLIDYLAVLLPEHVDLAAVEPSAHFGDRLCNHSELAWTWTAYHSAEG